MENTSVRSPAPFSMLTGVIRADDEYRQLLQNVRSALKNKPLPILVGGLCEGATEAFCASLLSDLYAPAPVDGKQVKPLPAPALILCAEEKDCTKVRATLESAGLRCAFFITRDLNLYNITASHDFEHERLRVLGGMLDGAYDAVITTPDAALSYTVPPEKLASSVITLDETSRITPADMAKKLVGAGYVRTDMVDGVGQFAIRGGIIDVYPAGGSYTDLRGNVLTERSPVRIELLDDEIDRMVLFTPETQRTLTPVSGARIMPAREILPDDDARARLKRALASQIRLAPNEEAKATVTGELRTLEGGGELLFIDKYVSLVYETPACLLDYLGTGGVTLARNTSAINDRLKAAEWRMNQTIEEIVTGGTLAGKYAEFSHTASTLVSFMQSRVTLHIDSMARGLNPNRLAGLFGFRTRHTVSYADNFALLCEDLKHFCAEKYRILLEVENEAAARNLEKMLTDAGFSAHSVGEEYLPPEKLPAGQILLTWLPGMAGFELLTPKIAVLSTVPEGHAGELSAAGKRRREAKKKKNTQTILSYADLEVGDYVVHEAYGIGVYTGIENLTVEGITRDYIGIRYAGTDKLYLPIEKLDRVSKYIGAHAEDGTVKLSKFGGDGWNRTKARTRAAVKDMAKDLIKLYAERMRKPGHAFPEDDALQTEFEGAFPYEETDAQLNAVEDIKADMEKPVPMDRLLCGDVGYGKTEVALRAAYKAVLDGKQVAILVPTTLLALQHYQTITSRMRAFAVQVDMLSRFRTPKQQELTLRRVKRGEVDILVGTHRIISGDVQFKDLGLLIVDEEQRFGVAQKEKIKQLAPDVDVLTLTATPIPRTLNMAMGGIRDISLLDEAPGNRMTVQTYVLEEDDIIVQDAIRRELHRGGQVFYLHNAVETIREVAAKLSRAIPEARITVAHGKMEKEELEDIWSDMLAGEIDILVCTTIIETGVDIPNANTLIVSNAHRLGLSQLHQIRGRVGRSSRRAYAYFTYPKGRALTEIAQKRLEAIRDYAEFGAGFKIALRDMEIRGVGNILGSEQHGHMDAVGYDLYIKLLNDAVLEEKGETKAPEPECTVTLNFDAFLPESYVPSPGQRIALYKKIALIGCAEDQDDVADELLDRYGDLPRQADNLLQIALIRAGAIKCGVSIVKQEQNDILLTLADFDLDTWSAVSDFCGGRLRMVLTGDAPLIRFRLREGDDALRLIHKMFEKYIEIRQKNNTEM